jgi:hypothetical protein
MPSKKDGSLRGLRGGQCLRDSRDHGQRLLFELPPGDPDHSVSGCGVPLVSLPVALECGAVAVKAMAVHLQDETRISPEEVDTVAMHLDLRLRGREVGLAEEPEQQPRCAFVAERRSPVLREYRSEHADTRSPSGAARDVLELTISYQPPSTSLAHGLLQLRCVHLTGHVQQRTSW